MGAFVLQNQFGGSLQRLGYHLHAVFGVDAQFNAGLHGGLDVLQGVCYATRGHGCASRHLGFGEEHGEPQRFKQIFHQLLLFGSGSLAGDEIDALAQADGGVGYQTEEGFIKGTSHLLQLFQCDACSHGEDNLPLFRPGYLSAHLLHEPGLHGQDDQVGMVSSFAVVCGDLECRITLLKGLQLGR